MSKAHHLNLPHSKVPIFIFEPARLCLRPVIMVEKTVICIRIQQY